MIKNQRPLTEMILFDYYMISSIRENEVHSPFPYYLEKELFQDMVDSAEILNSIVCRIIKEKCMDSDAMPFVMGKFPLENEMLSIKRPVSPFFWVRYDAFVREDGGIFFSEFNYDKPCAQREIAISDRMHPHNNPNENFRKTFFENFYALSKGVFEKNKKPVVAILVSPYHEEEIHLAHLYMDFLKELNLTFLIAGTDNIYVKDDKAFAFDQPVDILLRQFPTEYLFEIADSKKLIGLFEEGKLLIINDPRTIIAQTKSLFAYLWELAESEDAFLSSVERDTIKRTIPHTALFDSSKIEELYQQKDKYVIKAVYGRYSEQVYIGAMLEDDEWHAIINDVCESEELHIVQEFCPIRKDEVLRFNGEVFVNETAYGNFGIYLSNDHYCGCCIRWSPDYLTDEESVWISPVGVSDRNLRLESNVSEQEYDGLFRKINDEAAFEYGFTGGYTGCQYSFHLDPLVLEKEMFEEIKTVTNQMAALFQKTTNHVVAHGDILCPVLGISDEMIPLVSKQRQNTLSFLGRFDFVYDTTGQLKLLEFNAETPAGMIDSIVLNDLIKKYTEIPYENPNETMGEQLKIQSERIFDRYQSEKTIRDIGFASLAYPEDYYNTKFLFDLLEEKDHHFVMGEVTGLNIRDNKVYLYHQPLDVLYRHYPLDWFFEDSYYEGMGKALEENTLCLNEPSTFISQSKAFLALVWELLKSGFYNKEEKELIQKYIPYTSLNVEDFQEEDYCAKPYFEREGKGITFSIHHTGRAFITEKMVFQERVPVQTLHLNVHTTMSKTKQVSYPILGAYVIGNEFGGLYTRAGGAVTGSDAIYIPTYIRG